MSLRIYLAAPWLHRETARSASELLKAAGYQITREWWEHENVIADNDPKRAKILAEQAFKDLHGVQTADLMVVLNSAKSEGKAVEQGVAIDMEIPIVAVGERGVVTSNIFHYLANYAWFGTMEEAIAAIPTVYESWQGKGINRVQP